MVRVRRSQKGRRSVKRKHKKIGVKKKKGRVPSVKVFFSKRSKGRRTGRGRGKPLPAPHNPAGD